MRGLWKTNCFLSSSILPKRLSWNPRRFGWTAGLGGWTHWSLHITSICFISSKGFDVIIVAGCYHSTHRPRKILMDIYPIRLFFLISRLFFPLPSLFTGFCLIENDTFWFIDLEKYVFQSNIDSIWFHSAPYIGECRNIHYYLHLCTFSLLRIILAKIFKIDSWVKTAKDGIAYLNSLPPECDCPILKKGNYVIYEGEIVIIDPLLLEIYLSL